GANEWVTPAIEDVVFSCLAKDATQRPASARILAERYEAALYEDFGEDGLRTDRSTAALPQSGGPNGHDTRAAVLEPEVEVDTNVLVHHVDAWMPEAIATYKLRGFVHDAGGEIVESVPGLIRVRLGGRGSAYAPPKRLSSWLRGRRSGVIEVELRLHRPDRTRDSMLHIAVLLRNLDPDDADLSWRERCGQIYCDLRAYLMGTE